MSTQPQAINNNPQQATNNPQTAQTTFTPTNPAGVSGGGGSNFGGGMALSLYQFSSFLNEYMVDQQEMYGNNIGMRLAETKVKEETTVQEYDKQSMLQWMDCGKSALGAVISGGTFALDTFNTPFSDAGTLNDELNLQNKQLGELQGINSEAKNKLRNASEGPVVSGLLNPDGTRPAGLPAVAKKPERLKDMEEGILIPNNKVNLDNPSETQLFKQNEAKRAVVQENLIKEDPNIDFSTPEGQARIDEKMLSMDNGYFNTDAGIKEIEAKMNAIDNSQTAAALKYAENDKDSLRKVVDESDKKIDILTKQMETTNSRLTSARTKVRTFGEAAKGLGDAGFDAAKASYTKEIGQIKATNQEATFSDDVLNQLQQNLTSQIKENADTMRAVLSALAQAATRA